MARGKHWGPEVEAECIRLRVEERRSLSEISAATGVSEGTLSVKLRPYPLTESERKAKAYSKRRNSWRKPRGQRAKFLEWVDEKLLSRSDKAAIAEAAVLFRLALSRLVVFGPVFDGSKEDWVVGVSGHHKVARIQVKWARRRKNGLPYLHLVCIEGHDTRRRYQDGEFDFVVGYDLATDTAYVFSQTDVAQNATAVTIREDAAERWDKIRDFIMRQ